MHLIQNLELIEQDQTKPVTQTQSHHWLDRLRSRKGFPTSQHLDLGSFLLTNNTNTISLHTRPDNPNPNPTRTQTHNHSSILAQIFSGASFIRTYPYKKCPRKQPYPTKVHPPSSPSPASSTTTTAAADPDIFPLNITLEREREREREQEEEEEEEEEAGAVGFDDDDDDYNDLKGFSKSEVTVIDTSSCGWKSVKFVYRNQNVWKLRERKRKSRLLAKKENNKIPKENVMNMGGERPTQLV